MIMTVVRVRIFLWSKKLVKELLRHVKEKNAINVLSPDKTLCETPVLCKSM